MITINIQNWKHLKNGDYATVTKLKSNKFLIKIDVSRNTTVEEYALSLLHELLHAWLYLVKGVGGKTIKREHDFIYKVEDSIIEILKETQQ